MKVVFFGSSQYCLPVLDALRKNFDLAQVITRPDRPVGRKQILTPSPTKTWAKKNNIPVTTELSVDCNLAIVADYGKIIPPEVFNRPRLGAFNIHFSLLPKWRGASPVQAALLANEKSTGITIFKIEKTLDTGPILWQKEYPIEPTDTAETIYNRLFSQAARELPNIDFTSPLRPQTGKPTFCKLLTRDDGFVPAADLAKPQTYNVYRAMYPWPGLWTLRKAQGKLKRMKILKCHLNDDKLVLDEIQFEGEKPKLV